jgi:hypothetical protein
VIRVVCLKGLQQQPLPQGLHVITLQGYSAAKGCPDGRLISQLQAIIQAPLLKGPVLSISPVSSEPGCGEATVVFNYNAAGAAPATLSAPTVTRSNPLATCSASRTGEGSDMPCLPGFNCERKCLSWFEQCA